MKRSRPKPLDGLAISDRAGKVWCVFEPGWQVWRWAGYLWRILHGMPSKVMTLNLPEGDAVVRVEPATRLSAAVAKLGRKAPVGSDDGSS